MTRYLLALVASLFAWTAQAAVLPATPSTVAAVFAKAMPGDTVALAPGAYGGLDLSRKFASPVVVACADPTSRPTVASLYIGKASNLTVACLDVAWKPGPAATTSTAAVLIGESDHVTFSDLKVIGGPAISGVPADNVGYTGKDGNVLGLPTGYGVQIRSSTDILLEAVEIAKFHKGLVIQTTQRVTVRRANIHDTRTTPVTCSNATDLLVTDSDLHDVQPWAWGLKTPAGVSYGDHADFLACWSDANQTTPNARVQVVGNRMTQPQGTAILGMWFQGTAAAPFSDATVSGNLIVTNNLQGIGPLSYCVRCVITGNTLRRADGSGSAGQAPTILLRGGSTGAMVEGNALSAPVDDKSGGANLIGVNTVLAGAANIYSATSAPTPLPAPAPVPAPTPAPIPPTPPLAVPVALPDIVVTLLPLQSVATSKPGKTYRAKPGQRIVFVMPK